MFARCLVILLILLATFSCSREKSETSSGGKLQGVHKYYFPDGKLYLEINYKDSLPHGTTKRYFKSGQLLEQAEYWNGLQHGVTKTYYEDGTLSSITPYDSARIHGVKKKFRRDGSPTYEAPYHYDEPCTGLKEFFLSGNVVNNYPTIVFKPVDNLLKANMYTLEMRLSDKSKLVEFYRGELTDGKYIGKDAVAVNTQDGVGKIFYVLPPGAFVMEKINIIAKAKTDPNNYYVFQATYNLAAENR